MKFAALGGSCSYKFAHSGAAFLGELGLLRVSHFPTAAATAVHLLSGEILKQEKRLGSGENVVDPVRKLWGLVNPARNLWGRLMGLGDAGRPGLSVGVLLRYRQPGSFLRAAHLLATNHA